MDIVAPAAGVLYVRIEHAGLAVAASLDDTNRAMPAGERFGTMALTTDTQASRRHVLKVRAHDSPGIVGEICVSAFLVDPADRARAGTVRAFAAAGRATAERRWQSAFRELARAAHGFDRLGIPHEAAAARHAMAELAYLRLNRYREGLVLTTRTLQDYGSDVSPGLRSVLLALRAKLLLELGERERALQLFAQAEQLAERSPHGAREIPRLQIMRGFVSYLSGDPAAASAAFTDAASRCAALLDWECHARAQQNLAALAEETRNYVAALQAYAQALQRLNPDIAPELAAVIQSNYGRLQGTVGLFQRAEQSHLTALRLYSQVDDCDGARRGLAQLGTLLVQVGSIDDAATYLDRAASLECAQLLSLAGRHSRTDAYTAGLLDEDESVRSPGTWHGRRTPACVEPPPASSLSQAGKFAVFHALMALRDAAMMEDQAEVAARCLQAAAPYAVTPRTRLRLANATGVDYLQKSNAALARRAFESALAAADEAGVPQTYEHRAPAYLGLGRAALLDGRPDQAREYAGNALLLSSMRADVGQMIDSLQLLAQGLRASGEHDEAIRTYRAAVGLIEQVPIGELDGDKRATFLASQHAVFAELMDLLLYRQSAEPTEDRDDDAAAWAAFEVTERGRARSLRYAVNQAMARDAQQVHEPSPAGYQELMRRVAQLARSGIGADALSAAIEEISGRPADTDPSLASLSLSDLQRRLDQLDATLIEYAAGRHRMFAFVIDAGSIHVVPLGERDDIAAAAAELYALLRNHESAELDLRRATERLARLVLWPVSAHVRTHRIVFVPDDSLHIVPFGVLPWSERASDIVLVQKAEIVTMPSALFMTTFPEERSVAAPRLALIGDPVFRADQWLRECRTSASGPDAVAPDGDRSLSEWARTLPRLPGTREEVLSIARLARATRPASHIDVRLGCDATAAALRQAAERGAGLLHIATHGYVDANRPRLSALALTYDPSTEVAGNSGRGTTFGLLDILGLRLRSPLVVLSACDTSQGRLLPGEGVLGPAPAFLQAGAATVVASYWRVEDEATAEFMHRFYEYLLVHRLPVATALNRAQIDHLARPSRRAGDSSRVWAAFAVHGWPDTSI